MQTRRIGVAISVERQHAEDQQLYLGVRDYGKDNPGFECVLAPFAEADIRAGSGELPYDGILAQATDELVDAARAANIPLVDVWFDSPIKTPVNCVFPDFTKAGRLVGQHLVSRGFENFGYIVNRRIRAQATMCNGELVGGESLGFEAYVKARGFTCNHLIAPRIVYADAGTWRRWSRNIREWILKQPKPLGLFVPNDMLCRHIADIVPELGLTVPYDLGLVCANNEPNYCLLSPPSLTAIDLGYRNVGYKAAALLDRMLSGKASKEKRVIVQLEPHALHPRRSTDATNVGDPLVAQAMRFILENTNRPIKVSDVAAHASTTRRTLERRFRDVLDRTVMQEITRCRLERLKRRLAESDTPIKVLAENSGFNSARVLYETFVREEGMSPSAYRAKRRPGKGKKGSWSRKQTS